MLFDTWGAVHDLLFVLSPAGLLSVLAGWLQTGSTLESNATPATRPSLGQHLVPGEIFAVFVLYTKGNGNRRRHQHHSGL